MSESTTQMKMRSVTGAYPDWDVEPVIEQIWTELGGAVDRPAIRMEMAEVLPRFERAPIQTFVPIFVRRHTVERLRGLSPGVTEAGSA